LILMIQYNVIFGQATDFIDSKLINSLDKTPVAFATILIKNKAQGLISNIDGGFKIPYELKESGDTLVISSIGYSSKEIPLSRLQKNRINIITLSTKTEILDGVILIASKKKKRRNAKDIVQLALDKIPKNYPFLPFSYVGYYRDYQIMAGNYVNLNEAIMQVYDPGFGIYDLKETQTRIYKYKKNPFFPTDTIAAKPYDYINKKKIISNASIGTPVGNEYTLLRLHDAIRNYNIDSYDFVNRLDLNFVKNHTLRQLPDTFMDDISLYSIGISKILENIKVDGRIFIGKSDFKIYKMQYAVYDTRKTLGTRLNSNVSKRKEKYPGKLLFEVILEYQLHNDMMYPKYISFSNSFESLQPAKFIPIDLEMNDKEYLKLTFNNTPLRKDALKKRNYKLWYKNEKMKIDSIEVNENTALLYLNKKKVFETDQAQASSKFNDENVMIKVKNIRDINGNVIHLQEYMSYNQYREFFVQELKISEKKPSDTLYLHNDEPNFLNQPIAPFKNLQNYWMNSPLKN
jgi:hypothetical protein